MDFELDYGVTRIGELSGRHPEGPSERPGRRWTRQSRSEIRLGDEWVLPTRRFWKSFAHRFRVAESIFRYFSHDEVFGRIAERQADDLVSYCLERREGRRPRLLAIAAPCRPVLRIDDVEPLVERYGAQEVNYNEGVISSVHVPRSGDHPFGIGSDLFRARYVLSTPLDGFGSPRIYLSLLREICSNGVVAESPAFRSEIRTGNDPLHAVTRALETYDNDEGFAALRQRFDSARTSWASLYECNALFRRLAKVGRRRGTLGPDLLSRFDQMCGRVHEFYGMANLDALSAKRQRVLPARCRVYDLLNFASEVATHHADPAGTRQMNVFVGTIVADEFDLENTAREGVDFQDLFCSEGGGDPELN